MKLRVAELLKSRDTGGRQYNGFQPMKYADFSHEITTGGSYVAQNILERHRLELKLGCNYYIDQMDTGKVRTEAENVARRAIMREVYGELEPKLFEALKAAWDGEKQGTIAIIEEMMALIKGEDV
jgi:hypothetical protein